VSLCSTALHVRVTCPPTPRQHDKPLHFPAPVDPAIYGAPLPPPLHGGYPDAAAAAAQTLPAGEALPHDAGDGGLGPAAALKFAEAIADEAAAAAVGSFGDRVEGGSSPSFPPGLVCPDSSVIHPSSSALLDTVLQTLVLAIC
jgi:hypothetical protein